MSKIAEKLSQAKTMLRCQVSASFQQELIALKTIRLVLYHLQDFLSSASTVVTESYMLKLFYR